MPFELLRHSPQADYWVGRYQNWWIPPWIMLNGGTDGVTSYPPRPAREVY